MRIADYVERDNFRQSVADAHTPGTTLPVCDPRLEAIVGHDRHDDGLVHNHDWALHDNRLGRPSGR